MSTPRHHPSYLNLPLFAATEGEDFLHFLFEFDLACEANGWPVPGDKDTCLDDTFYNTPGGDAKRLIMLKRSLRGTASKCLMTLDEKVTRDYHQLRQELTNRFMPTQMQAVKRTELKARRRRHNESLQQLADNIYLDTCRAFREADQQTLDDLAKDTFIDSLDDALRMRVLDTEPADLAAAVRRARVVEANVQRSYMNRLQAPITSMATTQEATLSESSALNETLKAISDRLEKLEAKVTAILDPPSKEPTPRRPKCDFCGRLNHKEETCWIKNPKLRPANPLN